MLNLLYSHARKSFKTNVAPWLPRGRIRAHEHERGGFSAGASGRMNQQWDTHCSERVNQAQFKSAHVSVSEF